MESINVVSKVSTVPTFDPAYANLDFVFYQILHSLRIIFSFVIYFFGIRVDPNSFLGRSLYSVGFHGQSAFYVSNKWLSMYKLVASIVSVLVIALIIHLAIRLWEIRKEQAEKQKLNEVRIIEEESYGHTLQWQNVLDHANSDNSSDWRLAILEADTILEMASQKLPVVAETLGERLKKINKGELRTIDSAWEAHKVRNRIAHEGFDFEITKRETLRVIALFQEVLHELGALKD